jgi:hypothetical protein
MRLVQLADAAGTRRVALVEGSRLKPLDRFSSVYELAMSAIGARRGLTSFVQSELNAGDFALEYDGVYTGKSEWRLLPPIDHPEAPSRCLISGTGLTHMASAEKRRTMHAKTAHANTTTENDSIRMYKWGIENGRPRPGAVGISPEWFYKGTGSIVRACGEALRVPGFAEDAGEEPEIAGVYLVDEAGQPRRVGMTVGNEFADHQFEKRNYLYLASSKLRECALGPELWIDPVFDDIHGHVKIERDGSIIWSAQLSTGQKNMCHSLENIEHHHFKFPEHRRSGDVHVHFFGADSFSFGEGIVLRDKDVVEIAFDGFGRPLRNPILFEPGDDSLIAVTPV